VEAFVTSLVAALSILGMMRSDSVRVTMEAVTFEAVYPVVESPSGAVRKFQPASHSIGCSTITESGPERIAEGMGKTRERPSPVSVSS
jgi:hypothetical protein